ncbi:MAG: hypothetical protein KAR06_10580, partial [Deltaproteobacteria bacterium]|nr:hypothetical protein [Deltaproteobacteria bacterium]
MSFLDKYVEFLGKYLKYYSNPCCTNLKDKTQSKAKAVYVHSNEVADFSYGSSHPMRPARLGMTLALTKELGLLDPSNTELIEGRKTTEEEVLSFHTEEYLKALKEANSGEAPINGSAFGLGAGDNPAFKGVYDWSLFSAGSSVTCAEVILEGKAERAMNISGGLHHAMADRASGFCYINDPVIAINKLLDAGKRVAYIDIDAHHGDGVEAAYFETDKVLTVSIHESGRYLFPGTG